MKKVSIILLILNIALQVQSKEGVAFFSKNNTLKESTLEYIRDTFDLHHTKKGYLTIPATLNILVVIKEYGDPKTNIIFKLVDVETRRVLFCKNFENIFDYNIIKKIKSNNISMEKKSDVSFKFFIGAEDRNTKVESISNKLLKLLIAEKLIILDDENVEEILEIQNLFFSKPSRKILMSNYEIGFLIENNVFYISMVDSLIENNILFHKFGMSKDISNPLKKVSKMISKDEFLKKLELNYEKIDRSLIRQSFEEHEGK